MILVQRITYVAFSVHDGKHKPLLSSFCSKVLVLLLGHFKEGGGGGGGGGPPGGREPGNKGVGSLRELGETRKVQISPFPSPPLNAIL